MTQCPYARNETGSLAVVAHRHRLYIFVEGRVYMLSNPSDPEPHITMPTVAVSMSDTPAQLRECLNLPDEPLAEKINRLHYLALFNEVLNTHIATSELRDFYRQKWAAL